MTALVVAHVVCASVVPVGAIVAARFPRLRVVALATGCLALIGLATGLARLHAWEPTYRRAIYLVSHTAGAWLDRKAHFGIAAFGFALAAATANLDATVPPWVLRALWVLCAVFGAAALVVALVIRARVVPAAIY